jgi:hypothetical protein
VVAFVTYVQDTDRASIVILDDREAIDLEPFVVLPALRFDVPAVDWLDELAHRRQIQLEAEVVVCVGRWAESHFPKRRGNSSSGNESWAWPRGTFANAGP